MHECTAKDARRPKFRARNRYADVSPCKCLGFFVPDVLSGRFASCRCVSQKFSFSRD